MKGEEEEDVPGEDSAGYQPDGSLLPDPPEAGVWEDTSWWQRLPHDCLQLLLRTTPAPVLGPSRTASRT